MGEINYQETKARKDTTREQKIIRVAHERSSRRKLRAELEGPTSWNTGIPCEISTFQTGLTVCFASSKGFLACAWFFLRVKSDAMCWVWRVLRCVICCDKRAGDHHRQHPLAVMMKCTVLDLMAKCAISSSSFVKAKILLQFCLSIQACRSFIIVFSTIKSTTT